MTTTSERTSERAERARAKQAPTTARDARTASPAAPAHAAAPSCKKKAGMPHALESCWKAVLRAAASVAAVAAGGVGVRVVAVGPLENCHRRHRLRAVEQFL